MAVSIERSFVNIFAFLLSSFAFKQHFHDLGFDRMAFRDYIAHATLRGWITQDWFVGGNNTWIPTFSQWPIATLEKIFGAYMGDYVLALLVALTTSNILLSLARILLANRDARKSIVFFSVAISLLAPYWLGELGTSYENSLTTPLVLFGLLGLLKYRLDLTNYTWLFLSTFSLSFATDLKMTNVIYMASGLVTSMTIYFSGSVKSRKAFAFFRSIAAGIVLGIAPLVPWWLFVFHQMKNPIFPFYNTVFHSPYYPNAAFRDERWMMNSVYDLRNLFTGWKFGPKVSEIPIVDLRYQVLSLLLIVILVRRFEFQRIKNFRLKNINYIGVMSLWVGLSISFWSYLFFYSRYLEPIELLVGLIIVVILSSLIKNQKMLITTCFATFLLILLNFTIPNWGSSQNGSFFARNQVRWASPLVSRVASIKGILLTSGPTGFLRVSSPGISHMINLDSFLLPDRFKSYVIEDLNAHKAVYYVSQGQPLNEKGLGEQIATILGETQKINASCSLIKGPIYDPFVFCSLTMKN